MISLRVQKSLDNKLVLGFQNNLHKPSTNTPKSIVFIKSQGSEKMKNQLLKNKVIHFMLGWDLLQSSSLIKNTHPQDLELDFLKLKTHTLLEKPFFTITIIVIHMIIIKEKDIIKETNQTKSIERLTKDG